MITHTAPYEVISALGFDVYEAEGDVFRLMVPLQDTISNTKENDLTILIKM